MMTDQRKQIAPEASCDRRGWLTGMLGLGGVLAIDPATAYGLSGSLATTWQDEPASTSSRRPGTKFSLAAYSYRELLSGATPKLTLKQFVDDCARFGLEGTELTSYYFPAGVDGAFLTDLRGHCFRSGLDVSGTAVGNDFGFPSGAERTAQIADVKLWIDRAVQLGAPVIRIFAGHAKPGIEPTATRNAIVSAIQECCDYAGTKGIHLALENHGGPTETPAGLLELVQGINSRWFGVNLDTGNFHGDDVYADLAQAAPFAINVQVKVAVTGADGVKVPTDYRRIADILGEAEYRGYVVLEYEEEEDPREACPRHLDSLRDAFA